RRGSTNNFRLSQGSGRQSGVVGNGEGYRGTGQSVLEVEGNRLHAHGARGGHRGASVRVEGGAGHGGRQGGSGGSNVAVSVKRLHRYKCRADSGGEGLRRRRRYDERRRGSTNYFRLSQGCGCQPRVVGNGKGNRGAGQGVLEIEGYRL